MSYQGDRLPGDTLDWKFVIINSSGAVLTTISALAATIYKDNTTPAVATGLSVTLNFDGRNGLFHVRLTTASDPTFFSAGSDFICIIASQTPATPNMIGQNIGEFSLANRVPNLAQGEPGQLALPLSASMATKLSHLYKAYRNTKKQTATGWSLLGDDDTTVHQKTAVNDDGTTATKGKIISGP